MRRIRIRGLQRAALAIAGAMVLAGGALAQHFGAGVGVTGTTLVLTKAYLVNAGKVEVQPMGKFGKGWAADKQLFWSGGAPGAVLDLFFTVEKEGRYEVTLSLTRAPDYARLKVEVEGQASSVSPDPYAPTVMPPAPWQVGTFALRPGQRKVSLMIIGKHPKSTGYYVGVNHLRVAPVTPEGSGRSR